MGSVEDSDYVRELQLNQVESEFFFVLAYSHDAIVTTFHSWESGIFICTPAHVNILWLDAFIF